MTDDLVALGLTVVIECAVALAILHRRLRLDQGLVVLFVAGINLVSHPLAWTAHSALPLPPVAAWLAVECAVVLLEAAADSRSIRSVAWSRSTTERC